MNLEVGKTKIDAYQYKEEKIGGATNVIKGKHQFSGTFQGFGIISRGINGTCQGVIVLTDEGDLRCHNLDLVKIAK